MKHIHTNRVIMYILILFLVAGGMFFSIKYYRDFTAKKQSLNDSISSNNMYLSNNAALLITELMLPQKELVGIAVKRLREMNLNNDEAIKAFILDRSSGFTTVGGFYFGRNDGSHFTNSDGKLPSDYDPRKRFWYMEAERQNKLIITDSYIDAMTGKPCVTLAAPVYQNDSLMGVVGLDIFIDRFHKLFESLSPDHVTHYYVTDFSGRIIINDDPLSKSANLNEEIIKFTSNMNISPHVMEQDFKAILTGYSGNIDINYAGKGRMLGYYWTMGDGGWKVIALTDPQYYSTEISKINTSFYTFSGLGILVILLVILVLVSVNMYFEKVRIKYNLTHDVLTGLPNREYLELFYKNNLEKTKEILGCALLLIDVDNFKFINDAYGHATGDEILKSIADILKSMVPEDGLLLRSGGDEFAVLLYNVTIESAKYLTERLHGIVCDKPIQIRNKLLDITISTGYTVIDNKTNIMKFFSHANAALKTAKEEGKNKVVCLLPENINRAIDDPGKINELIYLIKNAPKESKFVLFLQPIMDIESKKIRHYEALIRLKGFDDELISPNFFIPVAERFGLISDIDRWVFEEVMKILSNNPGETIFMNLSGLSLTNNTLLEFFEKSITSSCVNPSELRLGFEITETASSKNFIQAQSWMEKFKSLGCQIALDDFGVGYTSFTYLRSLPVDYIKIDGSFVHNIDKDSSHRAIVQTINTLAVSLGKCTVAEFVENEAVLRVLREIGVKYGQGYHLGRPGAASEKLNFTS